MRNTEDFFYYEDMRLLWIRNRRYGFIKKCSVGENLHYSINYYQRDERERESIFLFINTGIYGQRANVTTIKLYNLIIYIIFHKIPVSTERLKGCIWKFHFTNFVKMLPTICECMISIKMCIHIRRNAAQANLRNHI